MVLTPQQAANSLLNFEEFAPRFLKVEHLDQWGFGKLVPFEFNRVQLDYHARKTAKNVSVKPRRVGMSTYLLGKNFHRLITVPQTEVALVTHKDEISDYMLGIVSRFRSNLKDKSGMTLNIETEIDSMSELRVVFRANGEKYTSSLFVGTAGAKIFGRAQGFNVLHLTEVAHWPPERVQGVLSGVMNCIPVGGFIDVESTPNGRNGYFYDLYQAAKRKEVPYTPFFFPWWWHPDYVLGQDSDSVIEQDRIIVPTDEEKDLIRQFKLTHDQIRWRRWKYREQDKVQKDLFRQEFPENDVDCWLTAASVFDIPALQAAMRNIIPPLEEKDFLITWKRRRWDRNYVIGVDVGEGLITGHYTVAQVLDCLTGEIVATLRARIPQDAFTERLLKLGYEYGTALVAVERNYGHGILELMVKAQYPNMHFHKSITDETPKLGFPTNAHTRPAIIDSFRTAVMDRSVVMYDPILIDECLGFQWRVDSNSGRSKMMAGPGGYDDSLFAAMIAWYVREFNPHLVRAEETAHAERYA